MNNILVEPAAVTAFLEQVLDDGGMKDVEPGLKGQMLQDLRTRLQNNLFATIVTKLPEEDLPAFEALVSKPAPQADVQQFIRQRLPNLDQLLAEAMLNFRKQYVKG